MKNFEEEWVIGMENSKKVFHCNVELTIDVIKSKWSPLILCIIGDAGIMRYGEVKRAIPNMNERVLSRQLRELEEKQLINREVFDELPLRVEYSLTEIGQSLLPILLSLGDWGKAYNAMVNYGRIDAKYCCS